LNTATAYESERGVLGGSARIQSASSASGGQVIGNLNAINDSIQVNGANGAAGGAAQVSIRFSNGYGDARTLSFYMNGAFNRQISFLPTGGRNSFQTTGTFLVIAFLPARTTPS
jgi:hypothetical protein